VSEKCIGCFPAVENGRQTQCTISCIGKIRMQGFLSAPGKAREDNPIDYLVHIAKVGCPLYPQFGLEPNVYYIPPIHVPPRFLTQMFGHGAAAAIAAYRKAADDKRLLGALLLFGATPNIIHRFKATGDVAVGYAEDGEEPARVPLKEPVFLRPAFDEALQTVRSNMT